MVSRCAEFACCRSNRGLDHGGSVVNTRSKKDLLDLQVQVVQHLRKDCGYGVWKPSKLPDRDFGTKNVKALPGCAILFALCPELLKQSASKQPHSRMSRGSLLGMR